MKIKKIFRAILILFASTFILVQCTKKDSPAVQEFMDAKLAADPEFSLLNAAIKQARLETFTKGPGPFTLLAPTDAALNAAGITTATLPGIDSITLTAFLLNHFQNLKRTSYEFPDGPNAPMASMAGFNNFASKNKTINKTYVNGATVTLADIPCGNGLIHKIDKALIQPVNSIRTMLKLNPNYSLMDSAITKAGLNTIFAPAATAPSTIFAIDNATMTANGYNLTSITALTAPQIVTLSSILRYHIVSSRNFTNAIKAGNLKTVQGTNVIVTLGAIVSIKGTSNASPFNLAGVDNLGSNGVIHEITGMLKP
jgi:uncharacterized surface protein with fasciclin (FAS1) repeats